MTNSQRVTTYFTGRVQGVGFRATTVRLSRNFDVTGRVRNLDDGRVELEAEGPREELEMFLERIQLEMKRHLTNIQTTWSTASGTWTTFEVRS